MQGEQQRIAIARVLVQVYGAFSIMFPVFSVIFALPRLFAVSSVQTVHAY